MRLHMVSSFLVCSARSPSWRRFPDAVQREAVQREAVQREAVHR
jgi:hypothetical protein